MPPFKKNLKRKLKAVEEEKIEEILPPSVRQSDEPVQKKVKWINKQRVLILALRGITHINRHLMQDIQTLLPHSKKDNKVEKTTENYSIINEIAEIKNCNKCVLFENRRQSDLYMWFANIGSGPSAKLLVENVYTMKELKLTGNCLKGSRPLLSFDETFTNEIHYKLLKELFTQIFSTPNHHPKSQPFIDHVLTFTVLDNRIWFRNYQILSKDGALVEVGPRFVLNPIRIFGGSFGGEILWENPHYVSTTMYRRLINAEKGNKYRDRKEHQQHFKDTKPDVTYQLDELTDIFQDNALKQTLAKEEKKEQKSQIVNGSQNITKKRRFKKAKRAKKGQKV